MKTPLLEAVVREMWPREYLADVHELPEARLELVDFSGPVVLLSVRLPGTAARAYMQKNLWRVSNDSLQIFLVFRWVEELIKKAREVISNPDSRR